MKKLPIQFPFNIYYLLLIYLGPTSIPLGKTSIFISEVGNVSFLNNVPITFRWELPSNFRNNHNLAWSSIDYTNYISAK